MPDLRALSVDRWEMPQTCRSRLTGTPIRLTLKSTTRAERAPACTAGALRPTGPLVSWR